MSRSCLSDRTRKITTTENKKRTRKIEMYRMSSHIVENSILIVFRLLLRFSFSSIHGELAMKQ